MRSLGNGCDSLVTTPWPVGLGSSAPTPFTQKMLGAGSWWACGHGITTCCHYSSQPSHGAARSGFASSVDDVVSCCGGGVVASEDRVRACGGGRFEMLGRCHSMYPLGAAPIMRRRDRRCQEEAEKKRQAMKKLRATSYGLRARKRKAASCKRQAGSQECSSAPNPTRGLFFIGVHQCSSVVSDPLRALRASVVKSRSEIEVGGRALTGRAGAGMSGGGVW